MTLVPTPTTNRPSISEVMSGERDSPDPLDCQEVGVASLTLPERLPAKALSASNSPSASRTAGWVSRRPISQGAASIDVEFQTEAVLSEEEVAERSTALRLMSVS